MVRHGGAVDDPQWRYPRPRHTVPVETSRRLRASPHGMEHCGPDSGRRHGQGPQTPECLRDPADTQQQAWHVCRRRRCHRQAIRAGLLQHTLPTSPPRPSPQRHARVPPRTWAVVQAPGPAWLPIVRETPQRTQAGNEGTCPRAPQKGRHWSAGAHAMACPLPGSPNVHPGHHAVPRKGHGAHHALTRVTSSPCLVPMWVAQSHIERPDARSATSVRLASVSPSMERGVMARLVGPARSCTSRRLPQPGTLCGRHG